MIVDFSNSLLIVLKDVRLGYSVAVIRLAVRPRIIGNGSPGNMPFLSSILNDRKHPNKMLMMEAAHEIGPNLISMWLESIE